MSVEVNISSIFAHYVNNQQIAQVKGKTIGECLYHLFNMFPGLKEVLVDQKGKLHGYINVYVNEESAYPEELAKPVKDGDKLHIAMLLEGG
ncbi:MoaD/ThiS family protein [Chloroflexota bacterium]